jgi:hypothetical protein
MGEAGFARKYRQEEDFSRKGAKAQSAAAFLRGSFAPLREKQFSFTAKAR